ncbi:MAG: helix-turn-helix domain-containing protein [Streptosporangiaceae bacterium]
MLSRTFVPLEVRDPVEHGFYGEVRSDWLGQLLVSELRSCPQACVRTDDTVRSRGGRHLLQVGVLLGGHAVVCQDGRSARLTSGGFVIYETARSFQWSFPQDSWDLAIFTFPRETFALTSEETSKVTVRDLSTAGPAASMLKACLDNLRVRAPSCHGLVAARLADIAADLVSTTMIENLSAFQPATTYEHRLIRKILRYIEDNIEDPELAPAGIADAHHVSRRFLYKVFTTSQGQPVVRWIHTRRLELCRRALLDPAMAHLPVSQIARRFGIPNPALFSRTFKAAYGLSPSECRGRGTHTELIVTLRDFGLAKPSGRVSVHPQARTVLPATSRQRRPGGY